MIYYGYSLAQPVLRLISFIEKEASEIAGEGRKTRVFGIFDGRNVGLSDAIIRSRAARRGGTVGQEE